LNDTLAKNFSGTARYSTNFVLSEEKMTSYTLALGEVSATVEVVLNGVSLGSHIGPVFNIDIPTNLLKKQNNLQITVASLMANRISYMDRNNLPWKIYLQCQHVCTQKRECPRWYLSVLRTGLLFLQA